MSKVSVFTLIERSVRNMGAVNSKVKDLAVELIKRSYHEGIFVQITSGYRSNAEQTRLYNQGRTTSGNIVTNAKAGQSIHNYGLAIDFVLVSEDGTKAIWNVTDQWRRVAAIGKSMGFQWGGDWSSFRDYPHLDMQRGMSLSQLASGKRPTVPNVPSRGYLGAGDEGTAVKRMQQNLTTAGYKTGADGVFGPGTEAIVRRFQSANGLVSDGLFGKSSEGKLKAILDNLSKASTKPVSQPVPIQKEGVEDMAKQIVVISSLSDWGVAEMIAIRKKIAIMPEGAVTDNAAEELILVGSDGKGMKAKKITNLSGKDRFETSENVRKYLSK